MSVAPPVSSSSSTTTDTTAGAPVLPKIHPRKRQYSTLCQIECFNDLMPSELFVRQTTLDGNKVARAVEAPMSFLATPQSAAPVAQSSSSPSVSSSMSFQYSNSSAGSNDSNDPPLTISTSAALTGLSFLQIDSNEKSATPTPRTTNCPRRNNNNDGNNNDGNNQLDRSLYSTPKRRIVASADLFSSFPIDTPHSAHQTRLAMKALPEETFDWSMVMDLGLNQLSNNRSNAKDKENTDRSPSMIDKKSVRTPQPEDRSCYLATPPRLRKRTTLDVGIGDRTPTPSRNRNNNNHQNRGTRHPIGVPIPELLTPCR